MNLHVSVDSAPSPYVLRAAIETALRDGAWPAGPEATVATAVADAVSTAQRTGGRP